MLPRTPERPFCSGITDDVFTNRIVPFLDGKHLGRLCLSRWCSATDPAPLCAGKKHWESKMTTGPTADRECMFRARAAPPVLDEVLVYGHIPWSYSILIGRQLKSLRIVAFFYDMSPDMMATIRAVETLTVDWFHNAYKAHPIFAWLATETFPNLHTLNIKGDLPLEYLPPRDQTQGPCAFPILQSLTCFRLAALPALLPYCPERPLLFWDALNIREYSHAFLERFLEPYSARLLPAAMGPLMRSNVANYLEVPDPVIGFKQNEPLMRAGCADLFNPMHEGRPSRIWGRRWEVLMSIPTIRMTLGKCKVLVASLRNGELRSSDFLLALMASLYRFPEQAMEHVERGASTFVEDARGEIDCLAQLDFVTYPGNAHAIPSKAMTWILSEPRRLRTLLDNPTFWAHLCNHSLSHVILNDVDPQYIRAQCGLRGALASSHCKITPSLVLWLHKRGCHEACHRCFRDKLDTLKGVVVAYHAMAQVDDFPAPAQTFEEAHPEIFARKNPDHPY